MSDLTANFEPRGGEAWRNPYPMYKALRDHDPLHHVADNGQGEDFWVLSRFDDVSAAASDPETYSSASGLSMSYGEKERIGLESPIVMMDPPEHTALRKLAIQMFAPAQVRKLEAMIREFIVERVERLRESGKGDIMEVLFKPLPSMVVAHFLGVPLEDRELFDRWTDAIVAANAGGDVRQARDAVTEMNMYFAGLVQKRMQSPGDDFVSALVHGRMPDGERVSMPRLLGTCFTLVTGGNDTTSGLLGVACELLTRHPQQRALLLEDDKRIKKGLEEFLRLASPVQGLCRTVTRDVEIHGRTIREGRKVLLLYASANRDEREFGDDAGELDVTRKFKRHLSFSVGPHSCMGSAAARLQSQIAIEELLSRCPNFSVDFEAGAFAPGPYVRRYESLPFVVDGAAG